MTGTTGVTATGRGVSGLEFLAVSGRVLWTAILAHGFIDTFGVLALYLGWDG